VNQVFDIAAPNGQRSAVALHLANGTSGFGATVLDALTPSTANARFYSGLQLGELK
jgi:hypothetical protein